MLEKTQEVVVKFVDFDLKMLAFQIIGQLGMLTQDESLRTLKYAETLLRSFMGDCGLS